MIKETINILLYIYLIDSNNIKMIEKKYNKFWSVTMSVYNGQTKC